MLLLPVMIIILILKIVEIWDEGKVQMLVTIFFRLLILLLIIITVIIIIVIFMVKAAIMMRIEGLECLTWLRIFENRWLTINMISKAFSWQKIAKLGKPLLLLCIWARGGGSCKYGNFQHFCSKTLSGNAFFNVMGAQWMLM